MREDEAKTIYFRGDGDGEGGELAREAVWLGRLCRRI